MEKLIETGLMLDFYGQLLTDRQFEIMDMYFNNNYSLAEIAQELDISRQGVYDNIKRGKAVFEEYESKLKLVEKYYNQKKKCIELIEKLEDLDKSTADSETRRRLTEIKEGIQELINTSV